MIECREIVDSVKSPEPVIECQECKLLQKEFEKNPGGLPPRNKGLIFAALTGGAAIAVSSICVPFVLPALRRVCLPYVPATNQQIKNVMTALKNRQGSLVDIGSGDGRIVLEAAKHGFRSHGVELNSVLVMYSKLQAWRLGLRGQASFARQDLWNSDFAKYDNVVIFGVEQMMPELQAKLGKELARESLVVACRFPFPDWKAVAEHGSGVDTVWTYRPAVPADR